MPHSQPKKVATSTPSPGQSTGVMRKAVRQSERRKDVFLIERHAGTNEAEQRDAEREDPEARVPAQCPGWHCDSKATAVVWLRPAVTGQQLHATGAMTKHHCPVPPTPPPIRARSTGNRFAVRRSRRPSASSARPHSRPWHRRIAAEPLGHQRQADHREHALPLAAGERDVAHQPASIAVGHADRDGAQAAS